MALGIPLGFPIGIAMDNLAIGPVIGVAIGAGLGAALESAYLKREQTEDPVRARKRRYIVILVAGLAAGVLIALTLIYILVKGEA